MTQAEPVTYRVTIPNPHDHLVHVQVEFLVQHDEPRLSMPAWTPGSYLLREFGRHVQRVSARVGDEARRVTKAARSTWRVEASAGEQLHVSYAVYSHELGVRTPHVDGTQGFLPGPAVFVYVQGQLLRPVRLVIDPPEHWLVFSNLPTTPPLDERADVTLTYLEADDYDQLADGFIHLGPTLQTFEFDVQGTPHRVVVWGPGNYELEALARDIPRVVRANALLFGGLPYERYVFSLMVTERGQGGLEHANGCALQWQRHRFEGSDYDDFLRLVAHEHFHVWNVKRIRPEALGPFDYLAENYTRALWAMEGVTSYFDLRALLRAGLISNQRYLEWIERKIRRVERQPGRRLTSLEEASFDAWIKLYRPHENTPNDNVSYYVLGSLVAMVLDLEIRRETDGDRSYDHVLSTLWERCSPDRGFADDDFKNVVVEVGGQALRRWVSAYIEGTDPIEWDHHLGVVGMRLTREEAGERPYLGLRTRTREGQIHVATVLADGPNHGGQLYAGDQLVALDGYQVTADNLKQVLSLLEPQGPIDVAIFRRGRLEHVTANLAPHPGKPVIVEVDEPTEGQLAQRRSWLMGADEAETTDD